MPAFNARVALVSRNYIGFELNGGIRSLRSRFCSECFDHDQFEFSHSLYREVVLTSWDRSLRDARRTHPQVSRISDASTKTNHQAVAGLQQTERLLAHFLPVRHSIREISFRYRPLTRRPSLPGHH